MNEVKLSRKWQSYERNDYGGEKKGYCGSTKYNHQVNRSKSEDIRAEMGHNMNRNWLLRRCTVLLLD